MYSVETFKWTPNSSVMTVNYFGTEHSLPQVKFLRRACLSQMIRHALLGLTAIKQSTSVTTYWLTCKPSLLTEKPESKEKRDLFAHWSISNWCVATVGLGPMATPQLTPASR